MNGIQWIPRLGEISDGAEIAGRLEGNGGSASVTVLQSRTHSLSVRFAAAQPKCVTVYDQLEITAKGRTLSLGRCKYLPRASPPPHRKSDRSHEDGDGRLLFLGELYDFTRLFTNGVVLDWPRKVGHLPVVWKRRESVRPALRQFAADLLYDMHVYRALLDDVDQHLAVEPLEIRSHVHDVLMRAEYPRFAALMDARLQELGRQTAGFTQGEHRLHGFYFRKVLWDIIMESELMKRANLKPRGYAGDSATMRMFYEAVPLGATVFAKFMQRHPVEHAGGQAVRNRCAVVAERLHAVRSMAAAKGSLPVRVLSAACGPACELAQVFCSPSDCHDFDFTLLDHDPVALADAQRTVETEQRRWKAPISARLVQASVRDLSSFTQAVQSTQEFDFVYSLGVFDYLDAPLAREVLHTLYASLRPGGSLLIGNFHPRNPSRLYMDYWADWPLLYRTEDEFIGLTEGLVGATHHLTFEPAGAQMLLEIRKDE